mmetsp:Transcript_31521/g.64965  ORF Transcript_31521/g.64965 Transcript_31521/m.64965 type:complete len:463 (-) Transcript_31521:84-1472(-)
MDALDVPPPSCLGEVCWSNDQVSPVCWGMSFKQFNDFVAACRSTSVWALACEKGHVNLYDVVTSLVKPWTRNTGCGIALRMNPKEVLQAELMVSHSWSECMDQCLEALSKFCTRQKNLEGIAVIPWFCAFAQYQSGDDPGDRGPTVAEQLALDPFGSVIRTLTSSGLGMVVIQTSLADVYSRLWCVYEIAEAVHSKAKVSMAYSQRALETRSGSFEEMLRARTSRASCRDPSDEQMIRQKVQQAGGFSRLDSIIFTFRLQAFQEMMHELHESTRDQLRSEIQKMTGRGSGGTNDVLEDHRFRVTDEGLEHLQDAKFATGSGGVGFILYSICLGPLALVFCILALPFMILCAPCILFYRHSLKAKTEPAVARIMADDPEAPVAAERRSQRKEHRQGDPTARRKEDAGPPAPASYGAGIVAKPRRDDSESGSDVGESFGDAGEDDELMLKRLEMAKKMAPQLFS